MLFRPSEGQRICFCTAIRVLANRLDNRCIRAIRIHTHLHRIYQYITSKPKCSTNACHKAKYIKHKYSVFSLCSTNYIDRNNLRVCFSSLYSQNMSYEWYALVKSFDFVLRNKVFCSTTLRLAFIVGLLLAFFANLKNVSETCRRLELLSVLCSTTKIVRQRDI